ncbi:MAG: hypothetical protein QN756_10195, partial [Nitrososphaeraceae archaeon]|nr:hypothetical protein [Nitrososphaeraceae archaeon]
ERKRPMYYRSGNSTIIIAGPKQSSEKTREYGRLQFKLMFPHEVSVFDKEKGCLLIQPDRLLLYIL